MRITAIGFFILFVALGCKEDKKAANIQVNTRSYSAPQFQADSAFNYIDKQVGFGPRVPGSEGHGKCADWLANKLEDFGLKVDRQQFKANRFDGVPLNGVNIMASLNPQAKKRVFISAHWDTRYQADYDKNRPTEAILGADDGASGVGVCLEIARILAATPDFKMGLDVVLFDAEDQGEDGGNNTDSWGIGAQKWSNKMKSNYRPEYGILLDMVGAKGAKFYQERYSVQSAPQIVYKVWKLAEDLGYGNIFLAREGRGVVDDHYFINRNTGWPVIDIIHTDNEGENGFGDHWHTHDDDMDVIDKSTLKVVGKVVTTVLVKEDLGKF